MEIYLCVMWCDIFYDGWWISHAFSSIQIHICFNRGKMFVLIILVLEKEEFRISEWDFNISMHNFSLSTFSVLWKFIMCNMTILFVVFPLSISLCYYIFHNFLIYFRSLSLSLFFRLIHPSFIAEHLLRLDHLVCSLLRSLSRCLWQIKFFFCQFRWYPCRIFIYAIYAFRRIAYARIFSLSHERLRWHIMPSRYVWQTVFDEFYHSAHTHTHKAFKFK